jgi:phytoene dehydrogenase-like protein
MGLPPDLVVVVGGGLAGLTAALRLGRAGIPAMLFHDAAQLGGRARTDCRSGFHLNFGPHRLYERGAAVQGLRTLGVAVESAPRGPNGGFAIRGGVTHTLPVGCFSLLTTDLLGPSGKRQIAAFLAEVPAMEAASLQNVSLETWLRTRLRDSSVLQVALAMIRFTTYSDEPDRLSAAAGLEQLKLSLMGSILYIHKGWGTLVAALAGAAESSGAIIAKGQSVVAVNVDARRAASVTLDDGTSVRCGAVIVATGPRPAHRLLGDVMPPLTSDSPVCVATLDVALRRLPAKRTIFAVGVDDPVCFSADSAVARVAPDEGAVVHVAKYLRSGTHGTADDERHLERTLDLLQPGWRDVVVHRRFLSTVVVSHALVSAESGGFPGRPSGRIAHVDNVFLAGDWVGPNGQLADASVASGMQAARAVERLSASTVEADGTQ